MQKKDIIIAASVFVMLAASLFFLPHTVKKKSNNKPIVAVTTNIIADAVKHIAGDAITLRCLMQPGIDPHSYHARLSDMHILLDADLILYNGLHLEGKMATILQKMCRFTPTYAVSDALDKAALIASPECENMYDPHIWFDVALWKSVTHAIADKLCALTPEHSERYRHNHQRYLAELTKLEQDISQLIAQIPEEKRFLVTTHDAFSYFGRAYNVHVIGLQGINLDAEPCIKDMHALIDTICSANIPAIFVESSLPHRSIEAIALAVQARGHQVIIGDELYGDTIGTAENNAETYIKTILHNVRALVKGLNPLYTVT